MKGQRSASEPMEADRPGRVGGANTIREETWGKKCRGRKEARNVKGEWNDASSNNPAGDPERKRSGKSMFRKSKRGREVSRWMVRCACRVRMLSCTPAMVSNIQQVTQNIITCFTEIQTLTGRGTDTPQLKEIQFTEFLSYSALFPPKDNNIERETFLKRADCTLAEGKMQ